MLILLAFLFWGGGREGCFKKKASVPCTLDIATLTWGADTEHGPRCVIHHSLFLLFKNARARRIQFSPPW